MKQFFRKPLSLAVAATLVVGGLAATNASAATDANATGDLAIVPYYTVKGNFITGIQIVNTTAFTQAVKVRLRRDTDSADVLDFNLIMSPNDVWSGFVSKVGDSVAFTAADNDSTCTVPDNSATGGQLVAPAVNAAGADEGYIEIIGMGQTSGAANAIVAQTTHVNGALPAGGCAAAQSNFLANTLGAGNPGVVNNASTEDSAGGTNAWADTDNNAFKVSYFIRDAATGMEMGDNAAHIVGFGGVPMMSNQQRGLANGDVTGFDFPDLDGGAGNGAIRGLFDATIRADLGAAAIINNWSNNPANNVTTDWVVTLPGQYLMVDPSDATAAGDKRDIPVTATLSTYDREETQASVGQIQVSPGTQNVTTLPSEVNVLSWATESVFGSDNQISVTPSLPQPFGWASLSITPKAGGQLIYDITDQTGATSAAPVNPPAVLGITAWQRKFATEANKNYGRIISHSRK